MSPIFQITGSTTLKELEAFVREKTNPQAEFPSMLQHPLAVTAIDLGEVAEACDRRFTADGDREMVAEKLGRALLVISLTAQASGTTIAKCIESFREAKRAEAQITSHAAAA